MEKYLKGFEKKLKKYKGSLISVKSVRKVERNAKEYLNKLSKEGKIERVSWGWYYAPGKARTATEFLAEDKNFKVVAGQTAASYWNGDFIHRETVIVVVDDRSYGKALEQFAEKRGWSFEVRYMKRARRNRVKKIDGLLLESPDEAVVSCIQNWAFADAFFVLVMQKGRLDLSILRKSYWKRVAGSNTRVGEVLIYGLKKLGIDSKIRKTELKNRFVKEEVDEAIEKVMEFV